MEPATESDGSAPGLAPDLAAAANRTLHNLTVSVAFTSAGLEGNPVYGGWDGPECDPSAPTDCKWVGHQTMVPSDALLFNGTFVDRAWARPDTGRYVALEGIWTFTGSIMGCTGSGIVAFPVTIEADASDPIAPNLNGEVMHAREHFTTPSNSTGMTVVDARMEADLHYDPVDYSISDGMLTGWLSCY